MAKNGRRVPRYLKEANVAAFLANASKVRPLLATRGPRDGHRLPTDDCRLAQTPTVWPAYYINISYTCLDCKEQRVWTAEQQQWWYEVAKGSIYARAVRCPSCRKVRNLARRGTPRRTQLDRMLDRDKPIDQGGDA